MPLFDFFRATFESAFFSLPLEGTFNFLYLFLNFSLLLFATFSSFFTIFSG